MATLPTKRTPDQRSYVTATVTTEADGLSDVLDLGGLNPIAIETSTAWTAAGMDFLVSQRSSANLSQLVGSTGSSNIRISSDAITTGAARVIGLSANEQVNLMGSRFLQLRSASTASAGVAQGAARELFVYLGVPQGPIK